MFNFLSDYVDGAYKILWLLIACYILANGGMGYLIRIISKPFKVDFSDNVIKKLDNEILDLQLLRLYHGINVLNKKDAQLVSKAIDRGILSEKDFIFLSFLPPIGKFKHGKADIALFISILALLIVSLTIVCKSASQYKYNYAPYIMGNKTVHISEIYVYDPIKKEYLNAKQCINMAQSKNQDLVASACRYLVTTDPFEKKELIIAIEKNNSSLIAAIILLIILFIMSSSLTIGYITYYNTNNKFIDFKKNETS